MTAAKTRVAVLGTVGKSVQIDPRATEGSTFGSDFKLADGSIATVESLRALLGIDGGTLRHKNLLGLKQGDDHPQYTAWAQEESIRAPWEWKIGSAQQWHINDERVSQNVPLIINIPVAETATFYDVVKYLNSTSDQGGFTIEFQDGSPLGDDLEVRMGFWTKGNPETTVPPSGAYGFAFDAVGHGSVNAADFIFRAYHSSTTASIIYSAVTNRAQLLFVQGTASVPPIAIGENDSGLFWTGSRIGVSVGGSGLYSFGSDALRTLNPVYADTGTAAAPMYTFSGDTDTGVFLVGDNQLGFATNGTQRLNIANSQFIATLPWRGPDGSNSAPSFSFSGDNDTGIYRVGADQIGFSTSGSQRLNIATTQFIATLPWRGPDGSNSAPTFSFSGDDDTGVYRVGADQLGFSTGGALRLQIGGSGQIGIGGATYGTAGQVLTSKGADAAPEWANSSGGVVIQLSLSDLLTDLSAGTSVAYVRAPKAFTLSDVRASLLTASSSGAVTIDINVNGSTILSTKLTIDEGENTSVTAATPVVLSSSSISDDDVLTFDIDDPGSGAKGLIVTLIGT